MKKKVPVIVAAVLVAVVAIGILIYSRMSAAANAPGKNGSLTEVAYPLEWNTDLWGKTTLKVTGGAPEGYSWNFGSSNEEVARLAATENPGEYEVLTIGDGMCSLWISAEKQSEVFKNHAVSISLDALVEDHKLTLDDPQEELGNINGDESAGRKLPLEWTESSVGTVLCVKAGKSIDWTVEVENIALLDVQMLTADEQYNYKFLFSGLKEGETTARIQDAAGGQQILVTVETRADYGAHITGSAEEDYVPAWTQEIESGNEEEQETGEQPNEEKQGD